MSLDIQWIGIEYKTSWPLHLWNDSQNESYPLWTSPLKHPLNLFTTYKITAKPRERERALTSELHVFLPLAPSHLILPPQLLHVSLLVADLPLSLRAALFSSVQFQTLLRVALRQSQQLPLQRLPFSPEWREREQSQLIYRRIWTFNKGTKKTTVCCFTFQKRTTPASGFRTNFSAHDH